MFLAALIAAIMVTPVIYWNINHDFISFRYQGSHIFGSLATSFKNIIESLAAQFGAYSPFLFIIAFYGFFKTLRSSNDYLRLSVLFGATIIIFFLATSLSERTLPHWPGIFYVLFIPIGSYNLYMAKEKWKRNYLYISIGLSLTLMIIAYCAVPFPETCTKLAGIFYRIPDYKSPFRDIYGFPQITGQADIILKNDKTAAHKAIAVSNWTMGSRTMYYSMPYNNEVFVIDNRKDQFDIWEKHSLQGYDLLFLNTHFHELDIEKYVNCDRVEKAGKIDLLLNCVKVDTVEYIWCRNYRGTK